MGLKDSIGHRITNFLFPYIQEQYSQKGELMPMQKLNNYEMMEKYLWYVGNENLLVDFYTSKRPDYIGTINAKAHYYYAKVRNDVRIIHSGIPKLVSKTKARVLMAGGIEVLIKEGEDKDTDKDNTNRLYDILIDNDYKEQIKQSIRTRSWAGAFAYKIIYDAELTEYPIWEVYSPFNFIVNKKKGRVVSIEFIEHINDGNTKYELHEVYAKGSIDYVLYKVKKNSELEEVPLTTLEETAELEKIEWKEPIMMAGVLEGESDYDGIVSEFDALDETWSQLMDEIRNGRADVYIPEILLVNQGFDPLRRKHIEMGTDEKEDGKNEVKFNQPDIRSEEYDKSLEKILGNILANVELSKLTIGLDESIGANSSGDSITERETTTLRTRAEMIEEWQPFLEKFFNTLLFADDFFRVTKQKKNSNKRRTDYYVVATFGDYVKETKNERIEQATKMITADIIDPEKALDEVYGESLTQEEKDRILANLGALTIQPTEDDQDDDTEE